MKRILKYAFFALTGVLLLLLALLALSQSFQGEVLEWLLISKHQTSHPISRQEASRYFRPDELPAGAHDIQYADSYCQVSPTFEIFVRFEAPVPECLSWAASKFPNIRLEQLDTAVEPRTSNGADPKWFDIHRIAKGVTGGKGYEGEPKIWIDTDRGIFYYSMTD